MSEIKEEKNNSTEMIDIHSEKLDEYSQEALIERKILAKILKSNFSINSYSGFNLPALEKIKFYLKKYHMFYGINIKEKVLEYFHFFRIYKKQKSI